MKTTSCCFTNYVLCRVLSLLLKMAWNTGDTLASVSSVINHVDNNTSYIHHTPTPPPWLPHYLLCITQNKLWCTTPHCMQRMLSINITCWFNSSKHWLSQFSNPGYQRAAHISLAAAPALPQSRDAPRNSHISNSLVTNPVCK